MNYAECSDAVLVERCQADDTKAFDHLVERYQHKVFAAAYRLLGNYADAEEVAQEAFINAYRSIGKFRGKAAFSTWLYRIAVNAATSRLRTLGRRKERQIPACKGENCGSNGRNPVADPPDETLEPSKMAEKEEHQQVVQQAINSLDTDFRTVIVLRDIEGHDYRQIADIVGVPVGTVKSRVHRGRMVLKDILTPIFGVTGETTT